MPIEILDLSGKAEKRVFTLLAGRPSVGKTTQVTTFPKDETLYVSVEKGELSIQGSGYNAVKIETLQDGIDLIEAVKTCPYRYIVIDSLSEYYDKINDDARERFSSKQNFAKHDEIKYWFFYIIKAFRDMTDKDIFFISHIKDEKNGPIIEQELCFDGKLPSEIKKQFDIIIHMDIERNAKGEEKRVFITSPSKSKIAKARVSPWLDVKIEEVEEANLYKLTKKLKGEN